VGEATGDVACSAVNPCTRKQQNDCQAAYIIWAKANPQKALPMEPVRNRWLQQHGRNRHVTKAATAERI